MTSELNTLAYAARPGVVLKYLGETGIVLAALQTVPAGVALVSRDYAVGAAGLSVAVVLALICGPLRRLPAPQHTLPAEALVVVALAFLVASLLLWPPLWAGGLPGLDAWFEAVSAVTTTGLTTLPSVETLPVNLLFQRAWAQWYGGLGIIVFAIALLAQHPTLARRLLDSEASDRLDTTTRHYARRASINYLALTAVGILLLLAAGAAPLPAVAHALSAISTGGFSTFDTSLRGFDDPLIWYCTAFASFCGAVSLSLYSDLRFGRLRRFFGDEELLGLVAMVLITWLLLTWSLASVVPDPAQAGRDGLMLAVFAQTTTGFSTVDLAVLTPFAKVVVIASMLVGGSIGSTAGGIKLLRMLLFLRVVQLMFVRLRAPAHAVLEFRMAGQAYEDRELIRALIVILLFAAICLVSWLAFLAAGYAPVDALFEVVSATGTVGLSTGIARPELETPLKLLLAFDMLAGRVEIVALLVLIHPRVWFGRRLKDL